VETILKTLPKLDIECQYVKSCWYVLYRRGIPCIPRKCIGKKVIFTPTNSRMNCTCLRIKFVVDPMKTGHQAVSPTIMVNTAPILNT